MISVTNSKAFGCFFRAKIDEKKSEKAVKSVLEAIKRSIPDLSDLMDTILEDIPRIQQVSDFFVFKCTSLIKVIVKAQRAVPSFILLAFP